MIRVARFLAVWLAVAAVSIPVFAGRDDALPPHRANVVLLAFRPDVPAAVQDTILVSVGATVIKRLGARVLMVSISTNRSVQGTIQSLNQYREVLYSEPDYASLPLEGSRVVILPGIPTNGVHAGTAVQSLSSTNLSTRRVTGARSASLQSSSTAALPNDPYIGTQWAVQNTGQIVNGVAGTAGADQGSSSAWGVTTGTHSVVVAVLDSGVQYTHPDLATNMWTNPGGVGGCAAGTFGFNVLTNACDPMDDDTCYGGHGTHVAGILGAIGNSGAGIAGVNWTTSILAVKWIDSNCGGYTSDLITAMDWVIGAKQAGVNVRVANDSGTWPGTAYSQALSDEIDLLGTNDILFVTAAGNTAQNDDSVPRYPCSYNRPNQLCAAATDENDDLSTYSNYGPGVVQLGAAGNDILSTMRSSNYGFISGASMSAAQVSGAAALVLSRQYVPVATLRSTILANVDLLPSLANRVSSGGRLNVCKAVPGCTTAFSGQLLNITVPAIAGTPQYGAVLSASTGIWTGLPTTYSYQWLRCSSSGLSCSPISGAVSQTYAALARADVGATLAALVTASNAFGSATAQSNVTTIVASATTPFNVTSTVVDGQTLSGSVSWQATPAQGISFLQFYIDGALSQTDSATPYTYNQGSTNVLDSTTLSNGAHVLGVRALASDNRTYAFYGVTVTVANSPQNTALPVVSGNAVLGQVLTASSGSWTNNPTSYSYRWNRCNTSGASCTAISGATAGNYTLAAADVGSTLRAVVTAANSAGSNTATSLPTAVVAGAVSVSTTSLPPGQLNVGYSATLIATGGIAPYAWSVVSGSLPPGLALTAASGVISGTPNTVGTSNFTIQVRDAGAQTATKAFSIAVNPVSAGIALLQSTSAQGTNAQTVSVAFPSANTAGNMIIAFVRMSSTNQTVSVRDSAGNSYADAVSQAQSSDNHQVHVFYARNISGRANTVTASFSSSNTHSWLGIYEYSGLSPTSPLDRTAAAQGNNSNPSTGAAVTTTTTNELIFAGIGLPYKYGGVATAGTGYTLAQQNTSTSRSANETAVVSTTGAYTATFVLNSPANWSAVLATFTSSSGPVPPSITTGSLPSGQTNSSYSTTLAAAGGVTPYTWSVVSGTLPAGLTLTSSTGVISGTPTTAGTSNFTLQVRDGNAQIANKALSIAITTAGAPVALQQSRSVEGTGVPSLSLSFQTNTTAGNLILAFLRMSSVDQTVTVTDTAGNIYSDAVSQVQSTDGHQIHLFYARNIAGGPNTVIATFSSTNNHPWLAIFEYSGLSLTNPLDQTAAGQGGDASPMAGPIITTANNELLFTASGFQYSYGGTVTAGSAFTMAQQDTGTSRAASEAAIVYASGSYTANFNLSSAVNWSAVLATFKQ